MHRSSHSQALQGQVAIVTGSARGIGKAIAAGLAARGADVVISDVDIDGAQATAQEISALGRRSLAQQCDVAQRAAVEQLVQTTVSELGRLDILVNNAGITRDGLLVRMSEEQWDRVLDINLKGTFLGCQAAAKVMMRQRAGKIVNVASITGLIGNPGQANYSASKAGVVALTKTVAKELAPRGINVNAVAPGFIATEMTAEMSEKAQAAFLEQIPLRRAGTPEDVAEVVCFLASAAADYITGECLVVDGGLTMR
ncbi:MAG: 3-oxoacyl-[acyl-carrier-protein] reductase [Candidatus Eisenbacteria bacterium]|nr:3-oxoacyl-[acyl-carrier-protein] reductase [Candidatus Eisenbacteria bacterium]